MQNTPSTDLERRWADAWPRRRIEPHALLPDAEAFRDDAERSGDARWLGRARLLLGSCRWRFGEYAAALQLLLEALDLLPTEDRWARAATLQDLGTVHSYLGQHEQAMGLLLESLALRHQLDDQPGIGDVYNNLGIIAYHRGDLDEAARCYHESEAIRVRLADEEGIATCRNNLGKVLTDQERFDEALTTLDRALEIWGRLANRRGVAVARNNVGLVHHRRRDLAEAARWYESSLALKRELGDHPSTCETLIHLGRLRLDEGRIDDAIELLDDAVGDAERYGIDAELAQACLALSDAYEVVGDHQAALFWHRRFHLVDRRVFDERSAERLQALQVAYQLARAEREGSTDALTGLANRRALDRRLREECARARRSGLALSVALLDLDHFKPVNDTYGHALGDAVLTRLADLLRDHTRASDLPARYGGEEFAIVFPDTGLAPARAAAEQLRQRIRAASWSTLHPALTVTASFGVATMDRDPEPALLLKLADEQLYRAKAAGRDRVRAACVDCSVDVEAAASETVAAGPDGGRENR